MKLKNTQNTYQIPNTKRNRLPTGGGKVKPPKGELMTLVVVPAAGE